MTIKAFTVNPLGVNCYVAYDETMEGVIIDCGCSAESEWRVIRDFIKEEGICIKHLLNTHLHFDHVWGNPYACRDLGINPEGSELDLTLYNNIEEMVTNLFGFRIPIPPMPAIGRFLSDGDSVEFGSTALKVIATPGHSRGSLCFYCAEEDLLFSGDTLFCGSMGRTDLEGGSMQAIMQSLQKLIALPESTNVLCGHGPSTTIGEEKRNNMYL